MAEPLRDLVNALFALVSRDAPACAQELCRAMGRTRVRVRVAEESFVVMRGDASFLLATLASPSPKDVTVESRPSVLLDLIDGRADLVSAVLSNTVRVQASPAESSALFDALRALVEGGARSPGSGTLIDIYRTQANHSAEAGRD